ncbi:hypothetical protein NP493_382g00011 [Ridgeia piscesae]|uniref:Uncharacterized protein n=1 Tax=Ridgeia piscesae TaxID=27915 RepID=A0AAD9L3G6_RIDPI|nr:hypothetical protein NP493_382g00011 [Ridgeia piscesae]
MPLGNSGARQVRRHNRLLQACNILLNNNRFICSNITSKWLRSRHRRQSLRFHRRLQQRLHSQPALHPIPRVAVLPQHPHLFNPQRLRMNGLRCHLNPHQPRSPRLKLVQ